MRPIRRGVSPQATDYLDYKDAQTDLISRISAGKTNGLHIASYCSYCERRIETNLAVEHIEPKAGTHGKPLLAGRWSNFLLACVNCNSTKGSKQVIFNDIYLPDRDNTDYAFTYLADGNIEPAISGDTKAISTLSLLGLDKVSRETYDESGSLIAKDRASQRLNIWGIAEDALNDYNTDGSNVIVRKLIVKNMILGGFFSVWMTIFKDCPEMKILFINALSGTSESGCYNLVDASTVSPHPNNDGLTNGGKI